MQRSAPETHFEEESDIQPNDASTGLANLRHLYIQPSKQTKPCHPIPYPEGLSFYQIKIILQTRQWMEVLDHLAKTVI